MLYRHLLYDDLIEDPTIIVRIKLNKAPVLVFGCFCMSMWKISDLCILRINEKYKISTFNTNQLEVFELEIDTYFNKYTLIYNEKIYGFSPKEKISKFAKET